MAEAREEIDRIRETLRQCQLELAALRVEQETWAEELSKVKQQRARARARADKLASRVRELEAASGRWRRLPRRLARAARRVTSRS